MDLSFEETIAALASPPGSAARGIVRLSGPDARFVLNDWFLPVDVDLWQSCRSPSVHSGELRIPRLRAAVPVEVYLWPSRRSYTGQPVVELHLPGSPPILESVLAETYRHGARPARPGEFTLRAFLAGKLDLLQAEAVLGVIDAHDHTELNVALGQLAGGLSGRLAELRRDLLELLADLEAGLDFIEEDIEFVQRCEVLARVAEAREFVELLLQQSSERMHSRPRARVVLAGLPNAGKSTVFNCLADEQSALVSPLAGTTRDFLLASIDWCGMSIDLVDTAGWELDSTGAGETAQQLRDQQLREADVLLWCSSAMLNQKDRELDDRLFDESKRLARQSLRVVTQIDRHHSTETTEIPNRNAIELHSPTDLPDLEIEREISSTTGVSTEVAISALTGEGLDSLAAGLRHCLATSQGSARQWLGMTAARCRESLESVAASLASAQSAAESLETGDELLAIDIRDALNQLGCILGTVYTDDILDRVFSKFCIGK